ncbi:hypothetical protein EDC94DRAFT_511581 [Helicostylum pulchrum]|nr:hypothetical protein EDC94DRAFT_511581 [Helicostylum pulchrum]
MQSWNWWEEQRKAEFDTIDFLQFLGFYCFLTGQTPDSNRLKIVVKYLTANKFGQNKIPYFTLLIDMRYMTRARKYLEAIIMQCIQTTTNSNDLTLFGPELTFLLQYLNPKTYQTKHVIDPYHLIDIPDKILSSFGQSILKTTLCQFSLRPAFILCVQEIVKLEDRSTKDVARIKAMKLWLTTMTRLTLFPIEHAEASSDALDIVTAAQFLWKNTLAVPYITCLISKMMVDRLRPWTLNTMPLLLQQTDMISTDLSGNGFLFLLANLVELSKSDKLVELTASFIVYIEPYFSDRQTPIFPHYHPIFKWSKAAWGNTLPPIVFDKAMKQMEYIWSRSFMDEIFADIISFEQKSTGKKLFKSSGGDIALFSMHVESIFSLYIQLTNLFKAHRKQKDINKEPLVQILKVFCEACSIVFLTLDDVDIFTRQKPFSPTDLIQISSFLNNFYFLLIKQQTDIPTEIPPSADSFRSARRLLLQIYDLDLHHPFCPPNHWLLISMSKGMKSFFSSIFSESGNNNTTSSASLFLSNLRQGDPVPLRILQLMPHTVSFDMRLKIFRDWIALDKSIIITKNNGKIVTVRRGQVLEDGFHALSGISPSAWKGTVRVSFVNEFGINEAGIDQGGPFKDFITMLINEAFEPNYGLFSSTKLNSFYPSATSSVHGRNHIQIFEFIGKVTY